MTQGEFAVPFRGIATNERSWWHTSVERFRRQHLVRKGVYAQLRSTLPVPVLAFVWVWVIHRHQLTSPLSLSGSTVTLRHLGLALALALIWNLSFRTRAPQRLLSASAAMKTEVVSLLMRSVLCGSLLFLAHKTHIPYLGENASFLRSAELGVLLTETLLAASFTLLLIAFCISARLIPYPVTARKALLVGSGPRAAQLRSLAHDSHAHVDIVGCLDDEYIGSDAGADGYLGTLSLLPDLLRHMPVELVLIGLPVKSHYQQIQQVVRICESVGVESQYMLDVFATTRTCQQISHAPAEIAVLGDPPNDLRHWLKRGLDLLLASLLLLLLLPVLAAIALAIKLTSPGPVFFVQQRYGQNRNRFPMFKFRTMVPDAEQRQAALEAANEATGPVFKIKRDPRVTSIGGFLRKTSLDELPQLLNVLRGDMALVGPRPLPVRDVSRFDEAWLLRRFSVRPGLTCLWQVRGRSNTQFEEWMKLDLEYIDSWTLALDFRILAATIPAVLRGSGAV